MSSGNSITTAKRMVPMLSPAYEALEELHRMDWSKKNQSDFMFKVFTLAREIEHCKKGAEAKGIDSYVIGWDRSALKLCLDNFKKLGSSANFQLAIELDLYFSS